MREREREVSHVILRFRIDLFRVQPERRRERAELVESVLGLLDPSHTSERLDEPERTRQECALAHAILACVAIDERPARTELAADPIDRSMQAVLIPFEL